MDYQKALEVLDENIIYAKSLPGWQRNQEEIEMMEVAMVAIENQIPKKAERVGATQIKCKCGVVIRLNKYCPYCGQALDWNK